MPCSSRNTATLRPEGVNASPAARVSGKLTRKRFEGEESTAALGSRNMPNKLNNMADAVAHNDISPRASRRLTGSGSSRERLVSCASLITPPFCAEDNPLHGDRVHRAAHGA